MLFIENPKRDSLSKVLKFIEIDEICDSEGYAGVRDFAAKLR